MTTEPATREPGGKETEETPRNPLLSALKKPTTWVVTTVAGALATILSGGVVSLWSWTQDTWADVWDRQAIGGVVYSPIYTGQSYALTEAIPGGPGRRLLREDADLNDVAALVHAKKGYRLGRMDINIVLQGLRHDPVRVLDVRPHVISAGPPPSGTCFTIPTAGGDNVFSIQVDLDHPIPGYGTKRLRDRFLKNNINLAYKERATVEVTATAEQRSYEWELQVDYVYGDGTTVQHAYFRDERGEPFRLSGEARRYRFIYATPTLAEDYRLTGRHTKC
ncbi:hypothetical protein [Sphaerisporangium perillae]|uniref:hypothetical protein n=1 Tax=Sphaerisporangium perillae TaxID=2935860 RepID=UPI00200BB9C7|nr:hypothetical protein [Sphaerisporangium perillae]